MASDWIRTQVEPDICSLYVNATTSETISIPYSLDEAIRADERKIFENEMLKQLDNPLLRGILSQLQVPKQ